jgi:hypothetical protein
VRRIWCQAAVLGFVFMVWVLLIAPAADAASTFRWSGGAGLDSRGWTDTANWEAGVIPSSSEPVALEFPRLTSASCTSSPPTDTCYESENDVSGLNVESMQVEDSQTYVIEGDPITLGGGGLTAAPATNTTKQIGSILSLPIALGASQTWNIAGQSGDNAIDNNQLVLLEEVTGSHPLNVGLSEGGGLVLVNEEEVGPLSFEGANLSWGGVLNGVVELYGAQLNVSDREPVSFNHVFVIGTGAIGPLTTDAAEVVVETGIKKAERLEVQSATLDPQSRLTFSIKGAGSEAGLDYGQLTSTGTVELNNAELAVTHTGSCEALPRDQVYTLLTTTGALTGSFGNAGEGAEVPVKFAKGCTLAQTLHVEYHRTGDTQSVTATVVPGETSTTSTTSLEASPAAPITNQKVTLTAVVQASSGTPSGIVEFDDDGNLISNCANEPVAGGGSGDTATCNTSFTASKSPEHLSAVFMPQPGLNLGGSSATDNLTVARAPTTTALGVSTSVASVNQSVTYQAVVSTSAQGLVSPTGTVQFIDNGVPMGSCLAQPLSAGAPPSTATCQVSYPSQAGGTHNITANYSGDANFAASSSSAQALTVELNAGPSSSPSELPADKAKLGHVLLDDASVPVHASGVAIVKLTCDGSSTCKGQLTLSVHEAVKGKHGKKTSRAVKIGSGDFSISAGKTASVDMRLSAGGSSLLRSRRGHLSATLRLEQGSGSTQSDVHLVEESSRPDKKKG